MPHPRRASGSRILAAVALAAGAVAAGAALGFSTARFTMNRREGGAEETTFITVRPAEGGGVTIAFAMPLH